MGDGPTENNSEIVYGGCEGPNAMFVKLLSSDGHEFIIKREHALTSGTIKAMLSGPGKLKQKSFFCFIVITYCQQLYLFFAFFLIFFFLKFRTIF